MHKSIPTAKAEMHPHPCPVHSFTTVKISCTKASFLKKGAGFYIKMDVL
jgi:hypothetical protein